MIKIDIPMPECCADCPLLVKMPYPGIHPVYLCRIGWKELKVDNIVGTRPQFCPVIEGGEEHGKT